MSKLLVITGPMFAGKSRTLFGVVATRVVDEGIRALFVSPRTDTRRPFVAHDGYELPIHKRLVRKVVDDGWYGVGVDRTRATLVGIDEAQFFKRSLPSTVDGLLRDGVDVAVAGLDLDAFGRPFGVMPDLMAMADRVVKLTATCACGAPATRSLRTSGGTDAVLVGGAEAYEGRCYPCWLKGTDR